MDLVIVNLSYLVSYLTRILSKPPLKPLEVYSVYTMFHHDAMFVMHHVSSGFIIVARLFLGHLIELLYGGELLDPKNSTSHHSKRLFVLLCDT